MPQEIQRQFYILIISVSHKCTCSSIQGINIFPPLTCTGGDPSEGVNENEEYCCMMRSSLGEHSLVYGAEVDGADPSLYKSPHRDLKAFVELKTCKEVTSEKEHITLHR